MTDRGQTTWPLCFRVPRGPLCLSPCLSPSVPTQPTPILSLSLFPAFLVLRNLPFLLLSAPADRLPLEELPSGHLTVGLSPWLHFGEKPSDRSAVGWARFWPYQLRLQDRDSSPAPSGVCPLPLEFHHLWTAWHGTATATGRCLSSIHSKSNQRPA